jgi:hypothetical protein
LKNLITTYTLFCKVSYGQWSLEINGIELICFVRQSENNMPMAPQFTRENAREMQARAAAKLRAKRAAYAAAEKPQQQADLRAGTTLSQIDAIDKLLLGCTDSETLCRLVAAKDKLWSMVLPKAGVMRPKSTRSSQAPRVIAPQDE